ncbi:MAG: peptidyl-prolyl cis-trans isomerase [Thermoleophilia bacterium]|jgi:foldase protein PrsA
MNRFFCSACGEANDTEAKFCQGCGAALGKSPDSSAQPVTTSADTAAPPPVHKSPQTATPLVGNKRKQFPVWFAVAPVLLVVAIASSASYFLFGPPSQDQPSSEQTNASNQASQTLPAGAVAIVDGKVISREDLNRAMEELKTRLEGNMPANGSREYVDLKKQTAQTLVEEELISFAAEKMNITVTDEEINSQLQKNTSSVSPSKVQIRKDLLFQKTYAEVTKDAASVTDEQVLNYYNDNPEVFNQPETRRVRHIMVADEATAKTVKARLNAGADFSALAKQVSTDPGSKDKGGDLGDFPTENSGMVPEFENAAKTLGAGQTSEPVKSSYGYHIIRVDSITPPGMQPFEEVKDQLKQGLMDSGQHFEAWFDEIKRQYADKIIYAEEYKPTPGLTP